MWSCNLQCKIKINSSYFKLGPFASQSTVAQNCQISIFWPLWILRFSSCESTLALHNFFVSEFIFSELTFQSLVEISYTSGYTISLNYIITITIFRLKNNIYAYNFHATLQILSNYKTIIISKSYNYVYILR